MRTVRLVRLVLRVFKQDDGDFMDVMLPYLKIKLISVVYKVKWITISVQNAKTLSFRKQKQVFPEERI
jgi:hypothetical protein